MSFYINLARKFYDIIIFVAFFVAYLQTILLCYSTLLLCYTIQFFGASLLFVPYQCYLIQEILFIQSGNVYSGATC